MSNRWLKIGIMWNARGETNTINTKVRLNLSTSELVRQR
jgi:hypothetical protein